MAVIVNDMSEVNIDAYLVRGGEAALSRSDESLVEMTNCCICCTLRDDLLKEVRALAEADKFDSLMIESTGISERLPVATTFSFRDEEGQSRGDVARLDTMVTVVNAIDLLKDYSSQDFLADRGESLGEDDTRSLVGLLVEQIEFANVVVINKAGEVSPDQLAVVKKLVASLNADAKIVTCDHGKVPLDLVIATGLYDEGKAAEHPLWAKELYGFANHQPENRAIRDRKLRLSGTGTVRSGQVLRLPDRRRARPCDAGKGLVLARHAPRVGGRSCRRRFVDHNGAHGPLMGLGAQELLARRQPVRGIRGPALGPDLGRPATGTGVHRYRNGRGEHPQAARRML